LLTVRAGLGMAVGEAAGTATLTTGEGEGVAIFVSVVLLHAAARLPSNNKINNLVAFIFFLLLLGVMPMQT
jgi:flavin-dependent dehydrogenase